MTQAVDAFGTLLQMGDGGSPENFTSIAEITDLTPPQLAADNKDVTSHDSPGRYREFIQGLKDAGEVDFNLNFIPTDPTQNASTGILSIYESGAATDFQIVFPDSANTTWSFTAFVTQFQTKAPIDDRLTAQVKMKVTGQPTLA